jgi:pimeloyl-ACP methyl ester carboxylesterase
MAGADIAFEIAGDGPTIYLLHPVGLDGASWAAVSRRLEARFRVVRLDLPGHGGSPRLARSPRVADYAEAVGDLILRQSGRATAVVGLSFGGMVAQQLALSRPPLVGALALCGCTATFADAVRPMIRARGEAALQGGMGAVVETTLERWFTPAFLAAGGAGAVRARLESDDPRGWADAWAAMSLHDCQPKLGALRIPVLCLAGEKDLAAAPEAMGAMAAAIPGGRLDVIAGAPHMMQIETPDAMADRLAAFVGALAT